MVAESQEETLCVGDLNEDGINDNKKYEVEWDLRSSEDTTESSDAHSQNKNSKLAETQKRGIWDRMSNKSVSSSKTLEQEELKECISDSLAKDKTRYDDLACYTVQTDTPIDSLSECKSVTRQSTVTPDLQRSISSLLRRVQYTQPRPSRSYSSMANFTNSGSPLLMASAEKRSHSVLERPRRIPNSRNFHTKELDSSILVDDIHIYVLQAKPILLNHLHSSWCAYLLNETLLISKSSQHMREICDIFLLENLYQQIKHEIMNQENSIENLYSLLHELLLGFRGKSQLKYIFWKDQMLYHFIVQKIETFMVSSQFKSSSLTTRDQELETDVYIENRQNELEVTITMLEILSAVLQDTDNIHDKIKMLCFHNGSLIRQLLSIVTLSPRISPKFYNTCCRMLEDFNEFSTYAWRNLPEAELISLSGTITNKVCGILSELLSTVVKLADANSDISVSLLFKDIYLENYLKRSITQLLGLLFHVEQKHMDPEGCIIVYQHFSVLKYLMDNLPEVVDYIREHYQEELRYYILWSRVNTKVPERYPIKCILQPLVDYIHRVGLGKINITILS